MRNAGKQETNLLRSFPVFLLSLSVLFFILFEALHPEHGFAEAEGDTMRSSGVLGVALATLATVGFAGQEGGDKVAKQAEAEGGKPVKGLVARAEVVEQKPTNGPPYFEVHFSLKNVSDKPITICDYVGHQPLKVHWVGPGGKTLKSDHYGWLRYADIAGLTEKNFVTIPAGGILPIGPEGANSAIIFQTTPEKPLRFGNVTQPGKHQVTVSFENKEEGKTFNLQGVWTGTVTANEVTFTVK
jgi:hypothetical protein